MTYFNQSQMFAQLTKGEENQTEVTKVRNGQRLITLRECGEASSAPDRVQCVISCSHTKKTAEEVKSSTNRRVDYILQTLRNNGLKDTHYEVHKLIKLLDDGQYNMKAEVSVTFTNVATYENTVNFLVEKLEASIHVSEPTFYVSPDKICDLRRQACLNAVKNCRTKAISVAQYLNQSLGAALLVKEETTSEVTGAFSSQSSTTNCTVPTGDGDHPRPSIQQRITDATVTVQVKIYAEFECNERTKKNQLK